jgi:hypothetical protein
VKVLKSKKKVTSLQVKVKFKFFTSLHVEVPESLLKYCNEVFLLRYRPTLDNSIQAESNDPSLRCLRAMHRLMSKTRRLLMLDRGACMRRDSRIKRGTRARDLNNSRPQIKS